MIEYTIYDPDSEVYMCQVILNRGSNSDEEQLSGTAHLFEHVFINYLEGESHKNFPKVHGYTSYYYMAFYWYKNNLIEAINSIKLFKDLLLELKLSDCIKYLDCSKKEILVEIKNIKITSFIEDVFEVNSPIGTFDSIRRINIEDINKFFYGIEISKGFLVDESKLLTLIFSTDNLYNESFINESKRKLMNMKSNNWNILTIYNVDGKNKNHAIFNLLLAHLISEKLLEKNLRDISYQYLSISPYFNKIIIRAQDNSINCLDFRTLIENQINLRNEEFCELLCTIKKTNTWINKNLNRPQLIAKQINYILTGVHDLYSLDSDEFENFSYKDWESLYKLNCTN